MNRWAYLVFVLILVFAFGCAQDQGGISKQTGGAIIGSIAGGVIGSTIGSGRGKTVATIGGAVIGGLLGSAIGRQLDERDRLLMATKTQTALETGRSGQAQQWRNPDTGHTGTVTPQPAYKSSSGQDCREFTQTINVEGKLETAKGTACRNPDGSWKIIQ